MALNKRSIAAAKKKGRYLDERGLYLQVLEDKKSKSISKSWLLRYVLDGNERWMGLGSHKDFSLDEARARAHAQRQLLADGIDPVDKRRAERRRADVNKKLEDARDKTFEEAAQAYYDTNNAKWKNRKHRAQFMSTLKQYAFRAMGRVPVAEIDTPVVLQAIRPIWGKKTETANRVRGRIEAVLNFAKVSGWRTGENPARWRGHLDQVLPTRASVQKVVHHRALPFAELPEFMTRLQEREGTAARALEFTILTAARTSEALGARWNEIDLENNVWVVPAERMKMKREHRVPLADDVVALLEKVPHEKGNEFVFIGPRTNGLSNMALTAVLKRMKYLDRATTHGFRSTFRDWVAERTSFSPDIAEAALAHVSGDKVERAYRRGDVLGKRRELMKAWADYARRPAQPATVHSIHQKPSKIRHNSQ